jgi:hypothetical protein
MIQINDRRMERGGGEVEFGDAEENCNDVTDMPRLTPPILSRVVLEYHPPVGCAAEPLVKLAQFVGVFDILG